MSGTFEMNAKSRPFLIWKSRLCRLGSPGIRRVAAIPGGRVESRESRACDNHWTSLSLISVSVASRRLAPQRPTSPGDEFRARVRRLAAEGSAQDAHALRFRRLIRRFAARERIGPAMRAGVRFERLLLVKRKSSGERPHALAGFTRNRPAVHSVSHPGQIW